MGESLAERTARRTIFQKRACFSRKKNFPSTAHSPKFALE
jgi:hypothetical protein